MKLNMYLTYMCTLLLLTIHTCSGSVLGQTLGEKLEDLADNALGWQQFQDYLDNEITFTQQPLDAPTLAKTIAESMSEKLQIRMTALKELQAEIKNVYNTGQTESFNPFTDCCYVSLDETDSLLNTEVNYNSICTVGQGVSSASTFLPSHMTAILKQKYQAALGIKYAFFGTEEGVMFNYPALRVCQNTYDPRFRPWYVETSTPEPKDVVIVIDRSGSMSDLHDGTSLMNIAIDAATTVLETMNPNDRVGIVAFSERADTPSGTVYTSTCYESQLAKASSQNKVYLTDFISSLTPSGGTYYNKALDAAFDYFASSPEISDEETEREKVILFLTDGVPTEDDLEIYQKISDKNFKFNNKIIILTYGLGRNLDDGQAGTILMNMATQVYNNQSNAEVIAGVYTPVQDPSNLRAAMGSYYDFFQQETISEPVFSIPYLDAFGTGLLISMCLPVSSFNTLQGVTCMDLSVDDMLSDITYFRQGGSSYAFIMDVSARVMTHPLLPSPSQITNSPYFIYLDSLEPIDQIDTIAQSMTSGLNGSLIQTSLLIVSRGDVLLEGVYKRNVQATYSWYPISGTSFSICTVVSDGDHQTDISWDTTYPEYVYHRLDLASQSLDTCVQFNRVALQGSSSVTFAARAFEDPFLYLYSEETSNTLNTYDTYLRGFTEVNPGFKEGIRETLAVTDFFDNFMTSRSNDYHYELNVAWSYLSTNNGIHRNYPGVEIPKNYDATERAWNLRSRAHKGRVTLSTPYEDAFGAGTVVTLSKAVYEGVPGGVHSEEDELLAVLGMDFTSQYLLNLVTESSDICSSNTCMVLDNAGFIIAHKDWEVPPGGASWDTVNTHLAQYEPNLASQLIQLDLMTTQGCVNVVELRDQYVWLISLPSDYVGTYANQYFEIHEIENTNLFLLAKNSYRYSACTSCSAGYSTCPQDACFCPCYEKANIYRYCKGVFDFTSDTLAPCTPPVPVVSFDEVNDKDLQLVNELSKCVDYNCDDPDKTVPGECLSVLTCSWCAHYSTGQSLDSPYCAQSDVCPGGIIYVDSTATEYPSEEDGGSAPWWLGIVIPSILLVVLVFCLRHKYKGKKHTPGVSSATPQATPQGIQAPQGNNNNATRTPVTSGTQAQLQAQPIRNHVYTVAPNNISGPLSTPAMYEPPPPYMEVVYTPHQSGIVPNAPPPSYDNVKT